MRFSFVASEIWVGLRRNLTMTLAVVVTVAISLALFGSALLIREQVDVMKGFWYDKVEVSIFLCGDVSPRPTCASGAVSEEQRTSIREDLEALPVVEEVFYESKEEAFGHFREQFKDSPDIVDNVTPEALPESFRVKLEDPEQFALVASEFVDRPGVDQVQDQRALLESFFNVLGVLQKGALAVAGLQVVAALLLISNTIRVAAFSRRRETGIMRLVGASKLYIQLPFLLEGVIAGLVGALLAVGALALVKVVAVDGILRETFASTAFVGWGEVLSVIPWMFLVAVLLSGAASLVTLRRHLRV